MRLMAWLDTGSVVRRRILLGSLRARPHELAIEKLKGMYGYLSAYEVVHGYELLATWPTMLRDYGVKLAVCDDYLFVSRHIKRVVSCVSCVSVLATVG